MTAASVNPLVDLHCLVLRPEGQGAELATELGERGATVTLCPTTEIQPVTPDPDELTAVESADWLVFISPNAVQLGLAAIAAAGQPIPEGTRLAAVGAGTARALREAGRAVAAEPAQGGGGAALLGHPDLQALAGRQVVIVRGDGGRETLAEVLTARGARVRYLEVYRRAPARLSVTDAAKLLHGWRCSAARVTIVTSVSGWKNLLALIGPSEREAVMTGGLVGVSSRVVDATLADGHRGPAQIAEDPSPPALAAAVEAVYRRITEID